MKRKTTKQAIIREPQGYNESSIVIYQSPEGVRIDVKLERETVWLTQKQMAELFDTERSVITKHLRNIFLSGELIKNSVCANFALTASDGKTYQTAFYNLDAVISVGYRVNSKRGTQFRIWASGVLRNHILKGYTVNEYRLQELNQTIRLITNIAERRELTGDEATALLRVVGDYSYALGLLDDYDHQQVSLRDVSPGEVKAVTVEEARQAVKKIHEQFSASDLFGREKDESLPGTLGVIMQTFDGKDVYPSLEEKASNLLYMLVKNHPFIDGNKRIAAALFLWFLEKNGALYRSDGTKRIADNALVAITLLIAESHPEEKDILTRVVVNLINRRNI